MQTKRAEIDAARSTGTVDLVNVRQKELFLLEAEQLKEFYTFVINNNLFTEINSRAKTINLQN
jgi:hypothetical protein